jgi:hypothetical protein
MDPYLEQHWGDVHTSLMVYMRDQISEQLPADLQARVEENIQVDMEDARRLVYPDVRIVEEPAPLDFGQPQTAGGVAVAEPCLIPLDEQPTSRHIEIVDRASGNRVVTAIELLSPANKVGEDGRQAYREKQSQYIEAGVNLVEIDLIRQGSFVLAVPEPLLPPRMADPYLVCIRRASQGSVAAVIGISLREPLPNIRIPLRPSDRDVVLQLQPLLDECYRRGRYGTIDYSQPLRPEFSRDDRDWIDSLISSRKR